MANKKKPTNKEFVYVINQIIKDLSSIKDNVHSIAGVLDMYIRWEGNEKKFGDFVQSTVEQEKEQKNDTNTDEKIGKVAIEGGTQNP